MTKMWVFRAQRGQWFVACGRWWTLCSTWQAAMDAGERYRNRDPRWQL